MTSITFTLYSDLPYQEDSAEVPPRNAPEPANIIDTYTVTPPRESFFTQFKVKEDYLTLYKAQYLKAEITTSTGNITIYGWVDGVSMVSDSDTPLTTIDWHIDLWRSYINDVNVGYGLVTKRPRGAEDPLQICSHRYRLAGDYKPLYAQSDIFWVIANITKETADSTVTTIRQAIMPVSTSSPTNHLYIKAGNDTVSCPSLEDFITGAYTERLKIAPSSISSVFVSPMPPVLIAGGTGAGNDPFVMQTSSSTSSTEWYTSQYNNTVRYIYDIDGRTDPPSHVFSWDVFYSDGTSEEKTAVVDNTYEMMQYIQMKGKDSFEFGSYTFKWQLEGVGSFTKYPDYLYWSDVDSYARIVMGNAYNTLHDGDTITFPSGNALNATADYTGYRTSSGNYYLIVTANVFSSAPAFTMHNGRFDGNIVLYGNQAEGWQAVGNITVRTRHQFVTYNVKTETYDGAQYGYGYNASQYLPYISSSLESPITTTDTVEWMMTDFTGNVFASVPWGLTIKDYTYRVISTSASAYLEFRFIGGMDAKANGLCYTIPLPSVDIVSNSWSEYVYSGQRDYDIQQRKLATQQALVSGISSGLVNTAFTQALGKERVLNKKIIDESGRPIHARREDLDKILATGVDVNGIDWRIKRVVNPSFAAGVGVMAGASVASAGLEYALGTYFNGRLQDTEDQLQAKQIDSIVANGEGWGWLWNGRPCGFISMVPDDYSLIRFNKSIQLHGVDVSEPTDNCDTLLDAGGPIQIQQAVVTGDVPYQALHYIRQRLAAGVRMIEKVIE